MPISPNYLYENFIYYRKSLSVYFYLIAQNYNDSSQAITKFLDGLAAGDIKKISPFVSDVLVYQTFTTNKEKNVKSIVCRKDNFLYAVQQVPKDSCTEVIQMRMSNTDKVLSNVCSNYTSIN